MKIDPYSFFDILSSNNIDFYTGVPDSAMKEFCHVISEKTTIQNHIISANEGTALGIATGYHLATGKIPFVYMQNSGFGNAINPLTSLVNEEVYSIPLLMMIGWRGEPETIDAIQHEKDGRIQIDLLESLDLPYLVFPQKNRDIVEQITEAVKHVRTHNSPFVLLLRRHSFDKVEKNNIIQTYISREESIEKILQLIPKDSIVVSTTGKTSRELHECKTRLGQTEDREFLVVGSMGHASSIALGISVRNKKDIYCLDGDGALIMHMGALSTIGKHGSTNFKHILLNNQVHDSVGGQPTSSDIMDYSKLSESVAYNSFFKISSTENFEEIFIKFINSKGPSLLEIQISPGSRNDLSRPQKSLAKAKLDFMHFVQEKN